jgi:glutamine amidotransferase
MNLGGCENRSVVIIDFGTGNIGSAIKMLGRIGVHPIVLSSPRDINSSFPLLIPGVGHFNKIVEAVDNNQWRSWLNYGYEAGRNILGICLGAQLFCQESEEGSGQGLGWVPTVVKKFPKIDQDGEIVRVPHMGWEDFTPPDILPFPTLRGRMYYAHSFYIEPTNSELNFPYQAIYGGVTYASIIKSKNAIGVQFHPEKSHTYGMEFLRNWVQWAYRGI